jgi:hypothetical protein
MGEGNRRASLSRGEGNRRASLSRGEGGGLLNGPNHARRGAAMVLALLILALVTAMGVFAATRSSMEQRIASNSKDNTAAFFTAEGGIRHGMALLKSWLSSNMAYPPVWTGYLATATSYYCKSCDTGVATIYSGDWLTQGVTVVNNTYTLGNYDYNYKVYAWNNNEVWKTDAPCTGTALASTDCDGIIYVRSVATVYYKGTSTPAGPESIQQATVTATQGQGVGMLSGLSQEFANEGKTSSAVDVKEISAGSLSSGTTM